MVLSGKYCCPWKDIRITYSELVFVALVIRHAMRCIVLSSVACPTPQYFATLFQKRLGFRKKFVEYKESFDFIFPTIFIWNVSDPNNNWAKYYNKCSYVFMYFTARSSQILNKLEISRQIFWKNSQISYFLKIRPVGIMRTDRHDKDNNWFS